MFKKAIQHRNAIGQKVTVDYADHNTIFQSIFPKTGIIKSKLKIDNGTFFTLELEDFFNYDGNTFKTLIVKERHYARYIGSKKRIDVHVLLPKISLNKSSYTRSEFDHAVWATIMPMS
ncbi:hypothetical protein [Flagellimonas beolgyonensis]|uniref:hypothetical protein n=1 Tax=Flagellimonas beolgyonensis TaxID=864064 RepID=UPI0013E0E164|nr:hypothetical protein [Allomuricauda beolgyonensis]